MKTGDNSEGRITEGKWCDHVAAHGQWLIGRQRPTIVVLTKPVHVVIEDGAVKILCVACFHKGIQVPIAGIV